MSRTSKIVIGGLIAVIILSAGGWLYMKKTDGNLNQGVTPLDPIEKLVGYVFFDKGTYAGYASAFKEKSRVESKEGISEFKNRVNAQMYFPGANSLEMVLSHMTVEYQDEENAAVSWKGGDSAFSPLQWNLVKIDGKWVIDN